MTHRCKPVYSGSLAPMHQQKRKNTKTASKAFVSRPVKITVPKPQSRPDASNGRQQPIYKTFPCQTGRYQLPSKKYIEDPECIALRETLQENPDMSQIETERLSKLIPHLQEYQLDLAMKTEYEEARAIANLSQTVKNELKRRSSVHKEQPVDLSACDEQIRQCNQKWEENFASMEESHSNSLQQLKEKQAAQLEAFDEKWATSMPRMYNKPSPYILELKQRERSLAIAGQYEEARVLSNEADQLSIQKIENEQEALDRDYNTAKDRLLAKHEQEQQLLTESQNEAFRLKERQRDEELKMLQNRRAVMQSRPLRSKPRADLGPPISSASVADTIKKRSSPLDVAMPKLKAPNDPEHLEKSKRKQAQLNKKRAAAQQRNAALVLQEYHLDEDADQSEPDE